MEAIYDHFGGFVDFITGSNNVFVIILLDLGYMGWLIHGHNATFSNTLDQLNIQTGGRVNYRFPPGSHDQWFNCVSVRQPPSRSSAWSPCSTVYIDGGQCQLWLRLLHLVERCGRVGVPEGMAGPHPGERRQDLLPVYAGVQETTISSLTEDHDFNPKPSGFIP